MRVCVVGAGLAGLSLVAGAGNCSVEMTVYERHDAVEALGGGIILQPVAARALLELGCFEEVRNAGAELSCLTQVRQGRRIEIRQRDVWPTLRMPTIAIHRHLLHAILLRRASELANIELSSEVSCLAPLGGKRMEVQTANGKAADFDLVIGADGAQSSIRTQVESRSEVRSLRLWWARWLVRAGSPIAREWLTERCGDIGVGTFPLGGGEIQVFATIPAEQMTDERRQQTIERLVQQSLILQQAQEHGCRQIYVGPAREVFPHVWQRKGVVFVGDAAHASSPTLSAGGALAIEDGLILGRLLRSGGSAIKVANAFEALRRRRLAWVAKVGRAQIRLSGGSPSIASPKEIAAQLAAMYAPLDDPEYLGKALQPETVTYQRTSRSPSETTIERACPGKALYDEIGRGYAQRRATDPRIAAILWSQLGCAESVLNVGAGTGSYEPFDRHVVAVEPSATMRAQRPTNAALCIPGIAEALPFPDDAFDVVMSVFSHWHWRDEAKGFAEMQRVARERVLVITLDRGVADHFWLTEEYLPEADELWGEYETTLEMMDTCAVIEVPVPGDCVDGFFHAFWKRPHAYLDPNRRKTMAVFGRMDDNHTADGLGRLAEDLQTGRWADRHASLLWSDTLDVGYRLLVHSKGGR